jgi:flagellar biosynthesis protein FlhF
MSSQNTSSPQPQSDVRTFRAQTTRAALTAIKAAMGSDAVIIETRQVGGLFGASEIEVVAARALAPSLPQRTPPPEAPTDPLVGLWPAPRPEAPGADLQAEVSRLRGVIEELRRQAALRGSDGPSAPPLPTGLGAFPDRAEVFRLLAERGVDEDLAVELIQQALRHGAGARRGELLDEVRVLMRKRLRPAPCPWRRREGERSGPHVVGLVGPTGVGKTTTVAKIAARALLEGGLKVGLVTVDTYRLGASDQLLRYGRIMGVRTHVAGSPVALREALAASEGLDLVLIDTAGRSDAKARAQQGELLRSVPGVELHLVLSAASGARELRAVAEQYRELAPEALVFSKLDEAVGPGSILSVSGVVERPVSCLTDGQRVPEDIHPASSRELVRRVIGR